MFRSIAATITAAACLTQAPPALAQDDGPAYTRGSIAVFESTASDSAKALAQSQGQDQVLGLQIITESINDAMPSLFSEINKFDVIGGDKLRARLADFSIEGGAAANPNDPRVPEALMQAGISHSIWVKIQTYEDTGNDIVGDSARRTIQVAAVAEIYDNQSGQLLVGLPFRVESPLACRDCVRRRAGKPFGEIELIKEIGDPLGKGLGALVVERLYPPLVVSVNKRRNVISVNAGEGAGMKVGDVYDIIEQEVIEDPAQPGYFIYTEYPFGKAKITRVAPTSATAEILEGTAEEIEEIRADGLNVILRKPQG